MNIFINNIPTLLPADCFTIEDLLTWKGLKPIGTAVAVNERLVLRSDWNVHNLNDGDHITIISAAFGG